MVLAAATVANFGQFGARVVLSSLVLAIALDFGVTKSGVGSALTGMLASRVGWGAAYGVVVALLLVAAGPVWGRRGQNE